MKSKALLRLSILARLSAGTPESKHQEFTDSFVSLQQLQLINYMKIKVKFTKNCDPVTHFTGQFACITFYKFWDF
jgi:hypothetical protein